MKVMIYSNERRMWWKENYCGYTYFQDRAGVFDYNEAHEKYPEIEFHSADDDFFVKIGE